MNETNLVNNTTTDTVEVINRSTLLGKEIDVYGDAENPLFLAKDVANWIEHSNPRAMLAGIDDDEKGVRITYTLGGNQETWFLTEDGLYEVLMLSRKPIAKQFKKGVKKILHEIRTTGKYATRTLPDFSDPVAAARAWADEKEKALKLEAKTKEQQLLLAEQQPKVTFADAITSSSTSSLIGELAKLIKQAMERACKSISIGQNRFYQWLRDNGYLGKAASYYNVANQEHIEQGLFELKKSVHNENGVLVTKTTTKVTGRGQSYFINGFLSGKFQFVA